MRIRWCRGSKNFFSDAENSQAHAGGLQLFAPLLDLAAETRHDDASLVPEIVEGLETLRPYAPESLGSSMARNASSPAPDASKPRALAALFSIARGLAASRGLLILVDDLQWADELSLSFLADYASRLSDSRVLVLANYRSEEAPDALADLAGQVELRLELRALEPEEVRAVIKDLLGAETLPEGLPEFIGGQSEGNPFLVAEYLRACIAQGALQREEGSWAFRCDSVNEEGIVPRSLAGLLEVRTARLSPGARRMLELLSVLGRDFDADTAAAMLDSAAECAEVLEELVAREILTTSGEGHFRFVHDRLRENQARSLSEAQRLKGHRRAADHLESLGDALKQERLAQLGYHWSRSREPQRALGYLESAAARARDTHALKWAAELYRQCLHECTSLPDSPERRARTATLSETLADVLVAQATHGEARRMLSVVLEKLPADDHLGRARAYRKIGASHWTVHEYDVADRALSQAEEALAMLSSHPRQDYWAELIQIRLGRFEQLYFSGRTGPLLDQLVIDLESLVEQHGSQHQRCVYYFIAASNVLLRRRYSFDPAAVTLAERGLEAAESLPIQRRALACFMVGFTLVHGPRSSCERALPYFERAAQQAKLAEEATLMSRVRVYHAIALLRLGRIDDAERAARVAAEAAEVARLPPYVAATKMCRGWVAWRKGDVRAATQLLGSARAIWQSHPHRHTFTNLSVFPLVAIAHAEEDFDAAEKLLAELDAGLPALPEALDAAVRAAATTMKRATARQTSDAIAYILRVACDLGFA
jgi:hypothetical protein